MLERWSTHMHSAIEEGRIPQSFQQTLDYWYDKNIRRFGEAKQSGDDCHETSEVQRGYLTVAGFNSADVVWNAELWGIFAAKK
jgi:hypothetical protein